MWTTDVAQKLDEADTVTMIFFNYETENLLVKMLYLAFFARASRGFARRSGSVCRACKKERNGVNSGRARSKLCWNQSKNNGSLVKMCLTAWQPQSLGIPQERACAIGLGILESPSVGISSWQRLRNSVHTVGWEGCPGVLHQLHGSVGAAVELAISGFPLHTQVIAHLWRHLASRQGPWHEFVVLSAPQAHCVHGKSEVGDCTWLASLKVERLSACCVSVSSSSLPCLDLHSSPRGCPPLRARMCHRLEHVHDELVGEDEPHATVERACQQPGEHLVVVRFCERTLSRHTNDPWRSVPTNWASEQMFRRVSSQWLEP